MGIEVNLVIPENSSVTQLKNLPKARGLLSAVRRAVLRGERERERDRERDRETELGVGGQRVELGKCVGELGTCARAQGSQAPGHDSVISSRASVRASQSGVVQHRALP